MVWFRVADTMLRRTFSINDQSAGTRHFILALLLVFISLPLLAQSVADDHTLDSYLQWEKAQPPSPSWDQNELLYRYAKHLKVIGTDESTIQRLITSLNRRLDVEEAAYWDKVYSEAIPSYNQLPNHLLTEAIKGVKPGKALDVEMGQGRNAVFLAEQGWDVTGIDFSPKALSLAKEHAREAGVKIRTVLTKDVNFEFGQEQWDLIALIYPMEKRSYAKVYEALKPGGIVVVEGFHQDVPGRRVTYASNELIERFSGFTILRYQDEIGIADWGTKIARLVKLVAQKPIQP
jgi:2-polyprenyl-3-methyl-5-hydroxy-6-metoxy-1,4-benzoquinol methylase